MSVCQVQRETGFSWLLFRIEVWFSYEDFSQSMSNYYLVNSMYFLFGLSVFFSSASLLMGVIILVLLVTINQFLDQYFYFLVYNSIMLWDQAKQFSCSKVVGEIVFHVTQIFSWIIAFDSLYSFIHIKSKYISLVIIFKEKKHMFEWKINIFLNDYFHKMKLSNNCQS